MIFCVVFASRLPSSWSWNSYQLDAWEREGGLERQRLALRVGEILQTTDVTNWCSLLSLAGYMSITSCCCCWYCWWHCLSPVPTEWLCSVPPRHGRTCCCVRSSDCILIASIFSPSCYWTLTNASSSSSREHDEHNRNIISCCLLIAV